MKKFCVLIAIFAVCVTCGFAMAGADENYNKLVNNELKWLEANQETWPDPGLTDEQIMECVKVIQEAFKQAGKEITDLQAALALGIRSTKLAAQESFRRSFQKAQKIMK